MPQFTIEATFRMPCYRQRTYCASTIEDACRLALEDEDWASPTLDWECAGETYITGIWSGADMAYQGRAFPVSSHFGETFQRKADHFGELTRLLDIVAQPMGVSPADFERWLPQAQAAVAKAQAILAFCRDPDEIPVELLEAGA